MNQFNRRFLKSSLKLVRFLCSNSGNKFALRSSPYKDGIHRSNAEQLISKIPVIQIAGQTAICDGGGGALGHPVEYIRVNPHTPEVCKYCGLRYIMSADHHH